MRVVQTLAWYQSRLGKGLKKRIALWLSFEGGTEMLNISSSVSLILEYLPEKWHKWVHRKAPWGITKSCPPSSFPFLSFPFLSFPFPSLPFFLSFSFFFGGSHCSNHHHSHHPLIILITSSRMCASFTSYMLRCACVWIRPCGSQTACSSSLLHTSFFLIAQSLP